MEVGSQLNGWTVDSLIGEGRFGKVYKLVRTEFGHTYESALKVIRIPQNESEYRSIKSEGLDDESISSYYKSVIEEIISECSLMYELKGNSNIVSYEGHQVVELEDAFGWEIYIRMELLTPLVKYLSEHKMTELDTICLGIDICKALEICQDYSIIHRDIKPENIFISKQHNYKLGDFGIARRMEGATAGMSKKGTVAYMAPEVFTGRPYNATVDPYSLGIVMYRFVNNNRTPFLPDYPEQITFSDKEQADWLRMSGESLPAPSEASKELSDIILKACAYDAKDRYKTPAEMRADLEKLYVRECESAKTEEDPAKIPAVIEQNDLRPKDDPQPSVDDSVKSVADFSSEKGSSNNGESNNKGKRKKTITAVAAVILIVCCLGVYNYFHHEVPTVVGKSEETAIQDMSEAGLDVDISRKFSDDVPKGTVISQSIEDATVKKGTVIDVVISRGKAIIVPDLTGKSVDDAASEAESLNLTVKVSKKKYSDTVSKGCVISQDPDPGEKIEEGGEILVVKSRGIEQVEVPDVSGISSDEAEKKLKDAGLNAEIIQYYSNDVEVGLIIGQDVDPGAKIDKNSTVAIYVSIGPAPAGGGTSNNRSKNKSSNDDSDWSTGF